MKALVLAPFADDALQTLKGLMPTTYESWTETRRLYSSEELAERINKEDINILVVEADFLFEEVEKSVNLAKKGSWAVSSGRTLSRTLKGSALTKRSPFSTSPLSSLTPSTSPFSQRI